MESLQEKVPELVLQSTGRIEGTVEQRQGYLIGDLWCRHDCSGTEHRLVILRVVAMSLCPPLLAKVFSGVRWQRASTGVLQTLGILSV